MQDKQTPTDTHDSSHQASTVNRGVIRPRVTETWRNLHFRSRQLVMLFGLIALMVASSQVGRMHLRSSLERAMAAQQAAKAEAHEQERQHLEAEVETLVEQVERSNRHGESRAGELAEAQMELRRVEECRQHEQELRERQVHEFQKQLESLRQQALQSFEEAGRQTLDEIKAANETARSGNEFEAAIAESMDSLSGLWTLTKMAGKFTADEFNGGSRLDDHFEAALKPLTSHGRDHQLELAAIMERHHIRMAEIHNNWVLEAVDLMQQSSLTKGLTPSDLNLDLQEWSHSLTASKQKAVQFRSASMSVTLEAVSIAMAVRALRRAVAKAGARAATSATTASMAAASDGPSPIMKIAGGLLLAGGAVWTACDVWQARKAAAEVEPQLRRDSSRALQGMRIQAEGDLARSQRFYLEQLGGSTGANPSRASTQ